MFIHNLIFFKNHFSSYIRDEDIDDEEESDAEEVNTIIQKSTKLPTQKNTDSNGNQSQIGIHQCNFCGNIFHNETLLKAHSRSHNSPKPHQCSFCSKHFKTRISLKIHIRSHTGERPYVCEVRHVFVLFH